MLSFIGHWGMFGALFGIGAAKSRRLVPTLIVGMGLAVIAPFVTSLAHANSDDAASYGWMGLGVIFIAAAIVAAVCRWRELESGVGREH